MSGLSGWMEEMIGGLYGYDDQRLNQWLSWGVDVSALIFHVRLLSERAFSGQLFQLNRTSKFVRLGRGSGQRVSSSPPRIVKGL